MHDCVVVSGLVRQIIESIFRHQNPSYQMKCLEQGSYFDDVFHVLNLTNMPYSHFIEYNGLTPPRE